eukprot:1980151-Amphidinium_carterae.1
MSSASILVQCLQRVLCREVKQQIDAKGLDVLKSTCRKGKEIQGHEANLRQETLCVQEHWPDKYSRQHHDITGNRCNRTLLKTSSWCSIRCQAMVLPVHCICPG